MKCPIRHLKLRTHCIKSEKRIHFEIDFMFLTFSKLWIFIKEVSLEEDRYKKMLALMNHRRKNTPHVLWKFESNFQCLNLNLFIIFLKWFFCWVDGIKNG